MDTSVSRVGVNDIVLLRKQFLLENYFQIRYNACHERNWADEYLLSLDRKPAGYGSVKGRNSLADRDTIFEFFLLEEARKLANVFFEEILSISKAKFIESQTNERLLTSLLKEHSTNVTNEAILFGDGNKTSLTVPDIIFCRRTDQETVFVHRVEPVGDYVLELRGEVVATGGFMTHYNKPFVDLVDEHVS